MYKFTVLVEGNNHIIKLPKSLKLNYGSPFIFVKRSTVFWNYNNVFKGFNDTVVVGKITMVFEPGYWTFSMIQRKIGHPGGSMLSDLVGNHHDLTCTVTTPTVGEADLGKFGELIGFTSGTKVDAGTTMKSPGKVEINRGLRYVEVSCDIVDTERNFNRHGDRSSIITTLPVGSKGVVNGTSTQYVDVESKTYLLNGIYDQISFTVQGNNGSENIGSVLMEIYIGIE